MKTDSNNCIIIHKKQNIKQELEGIDSYTLNYEDSTIKDLANDICDIVIDNYGTHNYETFKRIINERLKK